MLRRLMRDLPAFLVMLLAGMWCVTALPGCNTVEGVGEDVEEAGDAIEDTAEDVDDDDDPNDMYD